MRLLYLSLYLMVVSGLPARTYKRNYGRKMEVTEKVEATTEKEKIGTEASDKVEPFVEKEIDKENARALYEQSFNIVSSTIATISEKPQDFSSHVVNLPQVNIGWQALPQSTQAPKITETEDKKETKITLKKESQDKVYEVNIYVTFNEDGVVLEEYDRKKKPTPKPQTTTTAAEDYDYWFIDYVNFSDKGNKPVECPIGFKKVNGRCAQKKCQKGEALVGDICTPMSPVT